MEIDFETWLDNELKLKKITRNQLAVAAGLSSGTLSNIANKNRGIGPDTCTGIAKVLDLPPETVFRAAGLLPHLSEPEEKLERVNYKLKLLTLADYQLTENFIDMLIERKPPTDANTTKP